MSEKESLDERQIRMNKHYESEINLAKVTIPYNLFDDLRQELNELRKIRIAFSYLFEEYVEIDRKTGLYKNAGLSQEQTIDDIINIYNKSFYPENLGLGKMKASYFRDNFLTRGRE